jgi:hypothetical protein
VDANGNGPLVMSLISSSPLDIGDALLLPDGSSCPVVRSRRTVTLLGWRQEVTVGLADGPSGRRPFQRHVQAPRRRAVA